MPEDFDPQEPDPGHLRQMYEESAARATAAEQELAQLRAESMFRNAGLDPANNLHSAVMRGYTGEMTAEAIGTYVSETLPPPPAPPEPQAPRDDPAALQRMAEAARDSQVVNPANPDRTREIRAEMEKAYRKGDFTNLDRLSIELSRANGFQTKWDAPNAEEPSIPAGTRAMAPATRPMPPPGSPGRPF